MSDNSIAFAGMDRADEEDIRSLFARANSASDGAFEVGSEDSATVLVVDVDSVHGHMTWLRVHNDPNRIVVAVSSRQNPHAEHCLVRPVTVDSFSDVLARIAKGRPSADAAAAKAPQAPAGPEFAGGADAGPRAHPAPAPRREAEPGPRPAAAAKAEPAATAQAGVRPSPSPRMRLADYLVPGVLPGPSRLALPDAPELVVDPGARAYLGPAQLKGFAAYAQAREITPQQWQPVSSEELSALAGSRGTPHPWARLAWLSGLYRSPGELAPGHALADRFRLLKWPQIEREFPRHFRIATAMMKAPATAAQVAEASGTPLEEVVDFINASLAAGQAERVAADSLPEDLPAKAGGLLGRLKGLRGN